MVWVGVVVAIIIVLVGGAVLLKRRHSVVSTAHGSGADPTAGLSEADRVRRIAPAAPMVGLEAALDGVTDGHGRTLREQLDAGAPGVEHLRVDNDTSPILRRALDHVAPNTTTEQQIEAHAQPKAEPGSDGTHDAASSGS
jgi:hypothetical protein